MSVLFLCSNKCECERAVKSETLEYARENYFEVKNDNAGL